MNMKGHLIVGGIFYLIAAFLLFKFGYIFTPLEYLIFFAICLVYSLLPDVDMQMSFINNQIEIICVVGIMFFVLKGIMKTFEVIDKIIITILASFFLFINLVAHRGLVHSLVAGVVMAIPLYFWFGIFGCIFAVAGFLSHLIGDKMFKII